MWSALVENGTHKGPTHQSSHPVPLHFALPLSPIVSTVASLYGGVRVPLHEELREVVRQCSLVLAEEDNICYCRNEKLVNS